MKNIAYSLKGNSQAFVAAVINEIEVQNFLKQNNVSSWFYIQDHKMPDSKFYNAWILDGNAVTVDITKAKEIKYNQFRQARKPLLEQLDVEFMRAVESSNAAKKKSIAAKKQQLRDVTSIELPDDVDELAKFWPDVLNGA